MRRVLDATRVATEIVLLLQQFYTEAVLPVISRSVPEHASASSGLAALLRAVEDTTLVVLRKCVDAFFAQVGGGGRAGGGGMRWPAAAGRCPAWLPPAEQAAAALQAACWAGEAQAQAQPTLSTGLQPYRPRPTLGPRDSPA
jgi:hypothetical protein